MRNKGFCDCSLWNQQTSDPHIYSSDCPSDSRENRHEKISNVKVPWKWSFEYIVICIDRICNVALDEVLNEIGNYKGNEIVEIVPD